MAELKFKDDAERRIFADALGLDSGNRSMEKAGRTRWNEDDWDAACEAFEEVMGPPPETA